MVGRVRLVLRKLNARKKLARNLARKPNARKVNEIGPMANGREYELTVASQRKRHAKKLRQGGEIWFNGKPTPRKPRSKYLLTGIRK